MEQETALAYLKGKHPEAFKGWDEFEAALALRNRKGQDPVSLVTLYNKGRKGYPTNIHACFLITQNDKGEDVIRVGKQELADEYNSAYAPEPK